MKKDYLYISDFSQNEINQFLNLAIDIKNGYFSTKPLEQKTVACIFTKPSLRTRISFERGIFELGGNSLYITDKEIQLGLRESIHDVAKVLSRLVHMIMIRTFKQSDVDELAKHASIPVINGLTDLTHPCQVLGDILTVKEKLGKIDNVKIAFMGDGNNVFNSWLNLANVIPLDLRLGTNLATQPNQKLLKQAQAKGVSKITITNNALIAAKDAEVLYTDVWASMGEKNQAEKKQKLLTPFQINSKLMKAADSNAIVMHCLPANRGEEITNKVIDSNQSVVFDQAENRLHIQKAIMTKLANT